MNDAPPDLLELIQRIVPRHGRDGRDGRDGKDGADGQNGDRGERGPVPLHEWEGSTLRLQKTDGAWGESIDLRGAPGRDGQDGSDGTHGRDGVPGKDGARGARGATGKQGEVGSRGIQGPIGPMPRHEWDATRLRFELEPDMWGMWVDLRGPAGPPGRGGGGGGSMGGGGMSQADADLRYLQLAGGTLTGALVLNADPVGALEAATKQYVDSHSGGGGTSNTVLNGAGPPSGAVGADGDFYIDTASDAIYGPKVAGAWGAATSLIGPQGAAGATGATGAQGPQGVAGATGAQGPQGVAGTTGATGAKGDKGDTGDAGPTGATGPSGATGATGAGVPIGGTANQVLAKINSTDYNTQWVTPAASPLTTKGDLFTRSATADARIGIGSNDQVLIADSAQTLGLKWAQLAGANVANTPSGNLASSNVQAALNELQSDIDTRLVSPTTTKGDLIVRGASVDARVPVGADGTALLADSTQTLGVRWGSVLSASATPFAFKNAVMNGAMEIWQRGTSFTAAINGTFAADRWFYSKAGTTAVHDVSRSTDVPTVSQAGLLAPYSVLIDCTTLDSATAAGDVAYIGQRLEGYVWRNFAQRACTLSFWVKATKIGTYCVGFTSSNGDRSLTVEYTVSVTNTWERKTLSIPASPSAGTWDYTNGIGIQILWLLQAGTTYQQTPGAWSTTNTGIATANQVNACDSTANDFRLTLVQLEVGTTASDFAPVPYEVELQRCMRYFERLDSSGAFKAFGGGHASTTTTMRAVITLKVSKRIEGATVTTSAPSTFAVADSSGNHAVTAFSPVTTKDTSWIATTTSGTVAGQGSLLVDNNVAAWIAFDAEL